MFEQKFKAKHFSKPSFSETLSESNVLKDYLYSYSMLVKTVVKALIPKALQVKQNSSYLISCTQICIYIPQYSLRETPCLSYQNLCVHAVLICVERRVPNVQNSIVVVYGTYHRCGPLPYRFLRLKFIYPSLRANIPVTHLCVYLIGTIVVMS